jgi:arsenite methyltransferase
VAVGTCPQQTMYENGSLGQVTGGILRPGGWVLTEHMLAECNLCDVDYVLDVGCGSGYTIRYLMEHYAVHTIGLDRSETLLHQGDPDVPIACALGTALPVADAQVDIVLAECSLSVMSGVEDFLAEAWRI